VLWERRRADGAWSGLTDNYLHVVTQTERDLHNRIVATQLLSTQNNHLIGQVKGVEV